MKNKKINMWITIGIVTFILLIGGLFFFLNYSADDNSLTILEKKWITDHTNQIEDVYVYNDVPVYGYNGEGINFDFLDYFTKKYAVNFNKISYYADSEVENSQIAFLLLDSDEKVTDQDILLYKDTYVVLGIDSKDHITSSSISSLGVLESDKELVEDYFGEDVSYVCYEDIDKLVKGITDKEVAYVILPNLNYMDDILKNDLDIVYQVTDLAKKYVLRVADDTTYRVMKKSYQEYLNHNYSQDFSKNYLNVYFKSTNASDLARKNYNAQAYRYGYVVNMPFENVVSGSFVGTISNYLSDFEDKTGVEIEVTSYDTIDDLKSAMVSGDVDFVLGNFDYSNLNVDSVTTSTIRDLEYVVLSKNEYAINSIKGLVDQKVSVVMGSTLYQLCKDSNLSLNTFSNTDELLRSLDDQSIAVLDKETYLYYKDNKLASYKIILEDVIENGYKFLMNAKNDTFNSLFNYYVSTISYQSIQYKYHTDITIEKDYTTIKVISFIVCLVLFLIATIILINRKSVTNTVISKDEKLKYIDPMTSLKNRSYLNLNIYKWDDNVIFPQSVVVFDLNQIKDVNDKYGREAGDEIIKKVASILINNQLENTDIIRSGGDEFLIYMVGYDEKRVSEYMKRLVRLMKDIPNSLGVEAGYSMILDEVKTVDDAINEAIIMMTKNKEKRKDKDGKI